MFCHFFCSLLSIVVVSVVVVEPTIYVVTFHDVYVVTAICLCRFLLGVPVVRSVLSVRSIAFAVTGEFAAE